MNNTIYTIGYASFDIDKFTDILNQYKISCLVDVRSKPVASEYHRAYSKSYLEPLLKNNSICYRNYAKEFGARQTDSCFYNEKNYVDFAKFTKSDIFNEGVQKLIKILSLGRNIVLMCAEKDPISCHRSIMVTKALRDKGFNIVHIMPDETTQTQSDIDLRLLEIYFKNREQLSLFNNNNDSDLIEKAYAMKNAEIGYSLQLEAV